MRAEIEASNAPAPAQQKPMSDREWAALPAGDRELPNHMVYGSPPLHVEDSPKPVSELVRLVPAAAGQVVPGVAVVDGAAIDAAEVRLGFDMAMSMPVATTPCAAVLVDDTPPAASLIGAIATAYGVDNETACHWLCVRADDFLEWVEPTATPA